MLIVAAIANEKVRPMLPMRTNPASSVPKIAPAVLVAYSRLTRAPRPCWLSSEDLTTMGSVAPMSVVGTSSTMNDKMKRTRVKPPSEWGSDG